MKAVHVRRIEQLEDMASRMPAERLSEFERPRQVAHCLGNAIRENRKPGGGDEQVIDKGRAVAKVLGRAMRGRHG